MPEIPSVGQRLHGFEVTAVTPLKEINIEMVQLRHEATGARMVHLANEDSNNLFAVGFRTTPGDSTGIAHILEHTVLCGSRRFPVRDPFFSMLKRSLNTFMNALTSSDWTLYPFASMNEKDFYNLMDIYLDAAFFPLLTEMNFSQEGHRLEFADPFEPSSPLEFKGVVYNEMKGAMSDPSSLLGRRLNRALFPTVTYRHNSGGEPSQIPDLTHGDLKDFHAAYYHPSNSWMLSYGNLPLEKHLERIEEKALKEFSRSQVDSAVPPEQRYEQPRRITETFPIDTGEETARRSMVQLGWLTADISETFERMALDILSILLLGNPAAPLYKALLDSRLGTNLAPGCGYHDDYRTTVFAAGLQGTDPEQAEAIEKLVLQTLEEVAREGFSRERIDGAIHRYEFSHREVTGDSYPYPLVLCMRMMGPWVHCDDPVSPLSISENLERLRQEISRGSLFEDLIRKWLLDNPHRVTLTLHPDPDQKERERQAEKQRLEKIRAAMSPEEEQHIVERARALQQAQEAKEDLSCLPTLDLSDIPAEEKTAQYTTSEEAGTLVRWFDQPTNGIVYTIAYFDAGGLPDELQAYVPLFCALLTHIGAAGDSYERIAERIEAGTGGISASPEVLENPQDTEQIKALIQVKGKALARNQDKLFDLLGDLLSAPDFSDLDRLATVLGQIRASLENSIPASGHSYAARAAAARLRPAGRLREAWSGLELVAFAKKTAELRGAELEKFAETMKDLARRLLRREGLCCGMVAEQRFFDQGRPVLKSFLERLPAKGQKLSSPPPFTAQAARLGWAAGMPVSYVTRVYPTVPYTHADSGGLMVLGKLLRSGFLHREIREKGGAYGGMASCNPEAGLLSMLSYRDPHLARTLDVYDQAAQWAAAGEFSDQEVKEAILAVFAELDKPLSPGGKGYREFADATQGLTPQMRRELREKILATDSGTLRRVAQRYLVEGRDQSVVSVLSSEEQLKKANEKLGPQGLEIRKV
jgi:Zn-dependent M16 (insulinase) family peptidase